MKKLTLKDVKEILQHRILVASAKGVSLARVTLEYDPSEQKFYLYEDGLIDNVYSAFGAEMAISRFNDLTGATDT